MSEWKSVKLGEVAKITMGQSPSSTTYNEFGEGLPFLQGCADFGPKYPIKKVYCSDPLKIAELNSALISVRAPVGALNIADTKYCIGRGLAGILGVTIDQTFLNYLVSANTYKLESQSQGSTFAAINSGDLSNLSLNVPDSNETQRKIAYILSTIDEVIEKTEAAIDKYQAIKAGMMQDLFTRGIDTKTGKLRPTIEEAPELYKESELGWIPKEWEIVKIGDFAKIKGGKRMPAGKEFSEALTPFPYLRVTDMQNGSIDQSDLKYVPIEIEPLIRSYKISEDDVYVTIAGTLGLFGTIPVNLDQAQLTENAARITEFDKIEYGRDFIKHQCNSMIVQGQVVQEIGVGGGVPKLALYRIAKFLFLKPAIHEQQAIVERIRVIEHKLSKESVALTKYKQLKQGMMADLLTGKVKVKVNLNKNKVENG
ncbi:MAG TPA: restriction endonuclease subunit S [Candidatus Cloacimonadota bacterium]|mgnify:CR=1 FL=1|nr:restriction endonuclease subunit S [Candidatus Cloacimonadota bacterium]